MGVYQSSTDSSSRFARSKLAQRVAVTFTVGPLALWLIYLGGWFYFVPMAAVLLLATIEYVALLRKFGWQLPLWILLPAVLIQLVAGQWQALAGLASVGLAVSLLVVLLHALIQYERRSSSHVASDWAATTTGIVLLGWVAAHFFRLRGVDTMAAQWTILAIASTWVADSAAFVFGTMFGRRRLAARLSPNKTIEGYLAGVVLGTILTVLLASLLALPWQVALLIGLLISVVSPAGDLGISLLKREAGVKDSGNMLPGHGGALDRIDSVVWSVTITFYVLAYLA